MALQVNPMLVRRSLHVYFIGSQRARPVTLARTRKSRIAYAAISTLIQCQRHGMAMPTTSGLHVCLINSAPFEFHRHAAKCSLCEKQEAQLSLG